jgi:hypothetical protein
VKNEYLHINIPFFCGHLDTAFLRDESPSVENERIPMEFFVYTSIPSRCGMFTGMSEWGTQHARIPIHYIYSEPKGGLEAPLDHLQLWDSYSYYCSANQYDYLKNRSCEIILRDKRIIQGRYLFTLDWAQGGYSEMAAGHKTGHVLEAEGRILIQPNNRIIRWCDGGAFTTGRLRGRPDWKVFSREFSCEQSGSRWVAKDKEETYWYEFRGVDEEA